MTQAADPPKTESKVPERRSRPPSRLGSSDSDYSYGGGYGGGFSSFDGSDGEDDGRRRYAQISDRHRCRFCREKVLRVDYKDVLTLEKLCTNQGRIFSRKRSGNCAAHQRMVKRAIKQARFIGLLPFTV